MHYLLRTQFSLAAAPALRGHHTLQGNCRSRKTVCDSSGCRRKRDSVPVGTSPGRTGFKTKRRLLCARRRSVGSGPQCHWGHTHKSVCVPGLTVKQKSPRTPGGHRSTTWKPQHVLGPVWTHRAGSRRVGPSGLCPNGPSVLGIRTFEVRCTAGFLTCFT